VVSAADPPAAWTSGTVANWWTRIRISRLSPSTCAGTIPCSCRSTWTSSILVQRCNTRGLGVRQIAPGRGRRPTSDAAARAQIVATAQRPPERKTDGTATWSLTTLERRVRRDGLTQVGATTIRRVLEAAGSSYQKTRTWCPTGTARRTREAGVVTVVDPRTEQKRG